jgi:phosphocarrier protein
MEKESLPQEQLQKKKIVVKNKQGLHARPAATFVQIANKYDAEITVRKGKQEVNGKSIMGIMMLEVQQGHQIEIIARGLDAQKAINELEEVLSRD